MEILQKQYAELLAGQQFREEDLDPAVLARHIAALSSSALLAGCAVSIFDLHRCEHAYESEFHRALFSDPQQEYAGVRIHPEDLVPVARNGVAGMRHVFLRRNPNMDVRRFKLIREYRALVHGVYKRVTEEFQILETDRAGNVWLVLSIVNLSANQQPPYKVASQLIDTRTGIPFRRSTTFSTARRSSHRASGRCCIASRRAARTRRSPTNCTSASIRSTPTGSGSSRNSASTTRSKRSSTPGSSGFSMPDY